MLISQTWGPEFSPSTGVVEKGKIPRSSQASQPCLVSEPQDCPREAKDSSEERMPEADICLSKVHAYKTPKDLYFVMFLSAFSAYLYILPLCLVPTEARRGKNS